MNFLAHAVLAADAPHRIAGSLAGDFVKGVLYERDYPGEFSAEFISGVRLHRRVDAFSNREAHLRASADRLPKALRRIAPPCIDLMADHFLANAAESDPALYLPEINGFPGSCESLENYEAALHETLAPHLRGLSDNAARFFDHAKHTKLFSAYRHFERTARGVQYVCERLRRAEAGPEMTKALAANSDALQNDFTNYWPALCAEANRFIASATPQSSDTRP